MERSNLVNALTGTLAACSLSSASDLLEVVVDQTDGHGALADRRGHPFDRTAAHVAGGEHAGLAGLKRQRLAARLPRLASRIRTRGVGAGADEAVVVEGELVGQPPGVWLHTNEDEHRPGGEGAPFPGPVVLDHQRLEGVVAAQLADLGVTQYLDVAEAPDAVDQVA